jgi:hypothetical protein
MWPVLGRLTLPTFPSIEEFLQCESTLMTILTR